MQALNGWLKAVRATGLVLVRTRVSGPWGFAVQSRNAVVFHFVAEGNAFVRQPGMETIGLQAGQLILFPRGDEHEVVNSALGKAAPLETFLAKLNGVVNPDPKADTLICGEFDMDQYLALPALRALPRAVSLCAGTEPGCSALSDTLRMLRIEVETPNFGSEVLIRSLLSSLFVYFMREWVEAASPDRDDWFSAFRSPQIARVLALIHEAPERDWTLKPLAEEACLSRAAFSRNFAKSVGEPPHSYLKRWRMGIAAQLLEQTDFRLRDIASRVGYKSEFSFSRAFKSSRDVSPLHHRQARPVRASLPLE